MVPKGGSKDVREKEEASVAEGASLPRGKQQKPGAKPVIQSQKQGNVTVVFTVCWVNVVKVP